MGRDREAGSVGDWRAGLSLGKSQLETHPRRRVNTALEKHEAV